jgi:hypothetical protein
MLGPYGYEQLPHACPLSPVDRGRRDEAARRGILRMRSLPGVLRHGDPKAGARRRESDTNPWVDLQALHGLVCFVPPFGSAGQELFEVCGSVDVQEQAGVLADT